MATTKKSRQGSGDSSFDDGKVSRAQERAYKEGIYQMAQPVSRRPQFLAKVLVWGSVALTLSFVIYNAALANQNRGLNASLQETLTTQYNPTFKVRYADLGAEVINAWYSGKPAPINVANGLAWSTTAPTVISGSAPVAAAADKKSNVLTVTGVAFAGGNQIETAGAPGRFEERLKYYALVNGVPYTIGVSIAIPKLNDLNSTPTLIAVPSIIERAAFSPEKTDILVDPSGNPKMVKAGVSPQALSVIDTWAKAWTEDSPSSLKSSTADPDNAHVYRGLGTGWSYVGGSASVAWSVVSADDTGNSVARVSWKMQTPDTTIPATAETPVQVIPGAVQTQTMDILIGKYAQGSPSVVAWGQVGTYPELKPYMNAIDAELAKTLDGPTTVTPKKTTPSGTASAPAETDNGSK